MSGYLDCGVKKNCYNPFESYGEICVGCGCCSEDELTAAKARLALHRRLLEELENFNNWFDDPEMRDIQKRNVEASIKWSKEQIAHYQMIVEGGADG